jgi:hypothetical protein
MTTPTPESRALAIAAALAFTAGGLTILLGPALLTPLQWTAYHWLTILTVFGTIAAGHLLSDAWRAGRWLACLGFSVLFLSGTALVVYNSVGRQTEASGGKAMDAAAVNDAITAKNTELQDARRRLIKANDKVELYTNGGRDAETGAKIKPGCGRICDDWKQNRSDLVRVIRTLEADLHDLGPKKPVNAKAETFAEIAALFAFDKAKAAAAFTLIEPFLWTLFFEIGSIVSSGFAFRSAPATLSKPDKKPDTTATEPTFEDRKAAALAAREPSELSGLSGLFAGDLPDGSANVVDLFKPDGSPNGSGPKGGRRNRRTDRKSEVLADIAARHDRGERFASQEGLRAVLSERFGTISKSTLHDWLAELPDVPRRIEGRRKVVG